MLKQKSFIRYLKLLWICVYECRVGIRKRRDGGTNNIFAQIMVAQELKNHIRCCIRCQTTWCRCRRYHIGIEQISDRCFQYKTGKRGQRFKHDR